MNNKQQHLSPHQQLDKAILALVDALIVQRAAKWSSSEEEEIVGAEVGAAWDRVHTQLVELEWMAEAKGEAKAVNMAVYYMETFLDVKVDEYHRRELGEIVSPDNPSWYNPD